MSVVIEQEATRHTPWKPVEKGRVGNDPPESYEIEDARGCFIAETPSKAVAALLVASPEMLGLLIRLRNNCQFESMYSRIVLEIVDVIAKADGKGLP